MKKRRALYSLALICILSACLLTWWFTPVLALQTACDQITAVEGHKSNHRQSLCSALAADRDPYHPKSVYAQGRTLPSANASDRSVYQLVFLDQRGNEREMLYLNHAGSIRRGNLFYYDSSSSLCFNYLSDLESALFGTAVSASQCDDKPAPWELEHNPF